MTPFAVAYSLHLLAALIWVGGMFFAWMILRPAAMTALDGPARLKLWVEVFQRFFGWVWVAVVILPISGVGLLQMRFTGFETAPRYVQIMMGLYIVMVALFMRVQSLQLPELRRAVDTQEWAQGAAVMVRVRRLVGCNLLIGLAVVAIAGARPML
ncbi:CopD family protein [Pseudomonas sp. SIMBA_077]